MNKKLLSIILVTFALFIIFTIGNTSKAAEEPVYETISGGIECFFAKGTPITIESRSDGVEGAIIKWDGGSKEVTANVRVFGGGHYDNMTHETSNITMTGGTVRSIFGGGLHGSTVNTANVNIKGGKVTSGITGGGASILANSTCHGTTETKVSQANITVSGNANIESIYGGGEGTSSDVQNADVRINGGNINYLTAGGSNGNTEDADVIITAGNINVMQSVNRGTLNSAYMEVTGGTVAKLYVGGEEGDSNVTGTIKKVALDIGDDATVQNLYIGTSGGVKIGSVGSSEVDVTVAIYEGANVNIANLSDFDNVVMIKYVYVTVNGVKYELEKGRTLSYLSETLEKVKNVEGKDFVKFVVKGTNDTFSEEEPINADIELEAVYKDKLPKDNTPPTGANDKSAIIVISMIVLLVAFNIVFYRKYMR